MKKVFFVFFVLSIAASCIFPQGKILTKEEANDMFGAVLVSKEISSAAINSFTTQSSNVLMFNIIGNEIHVLDNKRKVLLPAGTSINNKVVFSVYSIQVVNELLTKGNKPITTVEKRESVLTITNGNFTLEFAWLCPPLCPW